MNNRTNAENSRATRFRTTRWQLVLDSQNCASLQHSEALAELCSLYWYPLFTFARRMGFEPQDAEDLTQSYFLHLLQKGTLQQVRVEKGRFRCFLLTSFRNHISVCRQHQLAAKRGGGCRLVSLDASRDEDLYQFISASDLPGEALFDAYWAELLLDRVANRLQEYYRRRGEQRIFQRLRGYLGLEIELEIDSYEDAAGALGLSAGGVKTLVFRMRKHFARLLREEVAKTVLNPADIDAEIHALCQALIAAKGCLR